MVPSGYVKIALEKWPIETVDLPLKNGEECHFAFYASHNQMVKTEVLSYNINHPIPTCMGRDKNPAKNVFCCRSIYTLKMSAGFSGSFSCFIDVFFSTHRESRCWLKNEPELLGQHHLDPLDPLGSKTLTMWGARGQKNRAFVVGEHNNSNFTMVYGYIYGT